MLELGAGLGLGSLCASLLGARMVVSTDFDQPSAGGGDNDNKDDDAVLKEEGAPSLLHAIARNRDAHAAAILAAHDHSNYLAKPVVDPGKEGEEAKANKEAGEVAVAPEWRVQPLCWGNAEQVSRALESLGGVCDLVLASECAYDDSAFDALFATLNVLCHSASNTTTTTTTRATEVLACHYPRIQAGGDVPELCAFETRATAQSFQVQRREVVSAATGVTYVLHSLTKSSDEVVPASHE